MQDYCGTRHLRGTILSNGKMSQEATNLLAAGSDVEEV